MPVLELELLKIVKDEIARSETFENDYFTNAFHDSNVPKEKRLSELQFSVRPETFPWLLQCFFEEHVMHLNGDPDSRDMGQKLRAVVKGIKLYRKTCNRNLGAMSLVNPTPERVQVCFDAGIPDVARDAFQDAIRKCDEAVINRLLESRDCPRLITHMCWISYKLPPEMEAKIVLQCRDFFSEYGHKIHCDSVEAAKAFYEIGLLRQIDLWAFISGTDYLNDKSQCSAYLDRLSFLHEYQNSLDIRGLMYHEPYLLLLRKEFPDIAATLPVLEYIKAAQKPDGQFRSFIVDRVSEHLRITKEEATNWLAQTLTELEA